MAKRDPRDVLGVDPGATPTQIKAAWRRLARVNHPDLTGDDPAASRIATRRMAEINEAYAALTRQATRAARDGTAQADDGSTFDAGVVRQRRSGPPAPKPTRPVTGRVDMSGTFQPRNQAVGNGAGRTPLRGQPPVRNGATGREPPRASTPTGPPVKGRIRHFRRPTPPSLDRAANHMVEFGKFHGHTLGQIAAFEPSYIDWLAGTVTRDPDLVAAARVIRGDLDRRGILRRSRPTSERPGRSA
jgi:curved DNA-binding protein CbpA